MSIDCIGVIVIAIGQVEEALFVSSQCAYRFGITIAFGLAEGELAEISSGGIVGRSIRVISQEVQGNTRELEMAASSQKPNVIIIRHRKDIPDVSPRGFHNGVELLGIGVYVEVGVICIYGALPVNIFSLKADFKKGGMQVGPPAKVMGTGLSAFILVEVLQDPQIYKSIQDCLSCHYYNIIINNTLNKAQKASTIMMLNFQLITLSRLYNKSMNDSITSADEKYNQPRNLFQEINKINTDQWRQDEYNFSPHVSFHSSFDQHEETSFSNDLPLQSKICEDLLQLKDVLQTTHKEAVQDKSSALKSNNKSTDPPSSLSSQSNLPQQITLTLHEESLPSKIYQENDTYDDSNFSTSLRSFLSLNQKNYRPHVICLKFLFGKLKEHSRQSLQNLKLYIHFLDIKIKQESRSLEPLTNLPDNEEDENEEDDVNIDERVLMEMMGKETTDRKEKRTLFLSQIQDIHQDLLSTWRKIKQKREKRERYIEEEIVWVIDRIELEMEDMIKCRLLNEIQKADGKFVSERIRCHNPFLAKDKYLQMKYLIQRENAYLRLITQFNGKLITYMINMFSKEEVQITKLIQEALVDYSNAYMNCYEYSDILALKMEKAEEEEADRQVKRQLATLLLSYIPKELYDIAQNSHKFEHSEDRLQAILGDFSNYLQNTIFISTIQMNNEFILFRNEAAWKTSRSFFENNENYIDYESRQALANSKSTNNVQTAEFHPSSHAKIVVVLTSNYYLHLENEDKIATVCLGEVKLSKRGRQIIISSKGSGLGGYLGMKNELGRLEFDTSEEVDIFAQKLSLALRRLAST